MIDSAKKTPRWRRAVGVSLIVIGAILAPVALVSNWAVVQISDTDAFVETFAPLAQSEDMQLLIATKVTDAINEQVDLPAITGPVFEGLGEDLGPRASAGLGALEGVVNNAIQQLVGTAVGKFVASDAFAAIWEKALRASHSLMIVALEDKAGAAISLEGGTVGIELGPIVEAAKSALVNQGLAFAANLPEVDRTIVVLKSEELGQIQTAYRLAVAIASGLPWIALILIIAGVFIAGASIFSVIFSAAGVALTMAILLIGLAIGRAVVIKEFVTADLPPDVARLLFEQVLGRIYAGAITLLVVGLVIAAATWLFQRFGLGRRLRERFRPAATA